ncbi:MAG: DUF4837 family protein [Calditrichaceae bacterium]
MKSNRHCKSGGVFVASILILIMLNGCDYKVSTMGYPQKVFVVGDSLLWEDVKDDVVETFESILYTPHVEQSFFLEWIPLSRLNDYKTRMNLFLIGVDTESNPANDYISKILPENFKQDVRENKYFYFFKDDLFARDQIGLIMYAKDRSAFKNNFASNKNEIFNTFNQKYFDRLKTSMYEKGEQVKIEKHLSEVFGWMVKVQHDYFVATEDITEKYVWLRRYDPDRWLSVWRVPGDSTLINRDSLIALRNRMAGKFYEGDHAIEEDTYIAETKFNGQRTKKLIGLWKNDSLLVGGPFRTYAVYNPTDTSLYMIDIAVMAPGKNKKPFLDQLEVMANTFEVISK